MLLVRLHVTRIHLLKLKAYKLFENRDADLSWLFFLKKPTCFKLPLITFLPAPDNT